jgi:hypothetical protein
MLEMLGHASKSPSCLLKLEAKWFNLPSFHCFKKYVMICDFGFGFFSYNNNIFKLVDV